MTALPAQGQARARIDGWLAWTRREPVSSLAALVALCLLTVMLWLPTGLSVGYWGDDWIEHATTDAGSRLRWETNRPLTPLPYLIGYAITPDGTQGLNLVLLGILFIRSAFLYLLLAELAREKRLAFAAAVLALLSPADTSVFNMATANVQASLTAVIAALYFAQLAWNRSRIWWLPMWAATLLALLTYELAFVPVLIGPLLLVFRAGRVNRRVILHAAVWYVPAALAAAFNILLFVGNPGVYGYQRGLASSTVTLGEMAYAQGRYVWRLFWAGWQGGFLNSDLRWYERGAAALVLLTGVLFLPAGPRLSWRRCLAIALAGACGIVLTSLLYLPTQLRLTYDRTLMYSGVCAAVCAASLLWLALRRVPGGGLIGMLALAGVAAVGMNGLIVQHQRYAGESVGQQAMLSALVLATGQVAPDTAVIVLDDTPNADVRSAFLPYNFYVEKAWQVVQAPATGLSMVLCYPDLAEGWGRFGDRCALSAEGVLAENSQGARQFPAEALVVLRYAGEGQAEIVLADALPFAPGRYRPEARVSPGRLPLRAGTMLGLAAGS